MPSTRLPLSRFLWIQAAPARLGNQQSVLSLRRVPIDSFHVSKKPQLHVALRLRANAFSQLQSCTLLAFRLPRLQSIRKREPINRSAGRPTKSRSRGVSPSKVTGGRDEMFEEVAQRQATLQRQKNLVAKSQRSVASSVRVEMRWHR